MQNIYKIFIFSILLQCCFIIKVSAQVKRIVPDSSFGKNGVAIIPNIAPNQVSVASLAVQDDGKIVVAGSMGNGGSWPVIMRFSSDGNIDSIFGTNGYTSLPYNGNLGTSAGTVKVLSSGKILANGVNDSCVFIVRLNANGAIDSTFGTNGFCVYSHKRAYIIPMAILGDGSIITGYQQNGVSFGVYDPFLVKADKNGVIDHSFGTAGLLSMAEFINVASLFLDHNNRIIISGNTAPTIMGLVRLLGDGTHDNSFGKNGLSIISAVDSAVTAYNTFFNNPHAILLSDNSIIMFASNANSAYPASATLHVMANGTQDFSYGPKYGLAITPMIWASPASGIALNNDEVLLAAWYAQQGDSYHEELGVLTGKGKIDTVLAKGKSYINVQYDSISKYTYLSDMMILPNGKILTAGTMGSPTLLWLAKYKYSGFGAGVNKNEFDISNLQVYPNPSDNSVTLKYKSDNWSEIEIRVFDITGKVVHQIIFPKNQESIRLETITWNKGIYIVQLNTGNQIATTKFVVAH